MSRISFDSHLIERVHLAAGALLNGCFQDATATGISFDGYLMASTGPKEALIYRGAPPHGPGLTNDQ